MIRTRDLVVFVALLLFLGVGIAVTLILENGVPFSHQYTFLDSSDSDTPTYTASALIDDISRQDVIERLRNALSLHTPQVEPSPSVVEGSVATENEPMEQEGKEDQNGIQSCDENDGSDVYAQSWPLNGVSLKIAGALRTVVHTTQLQNPIVDLNASSNASSTIPIQNSTILLAMPQTPYASADPHCVPGDVVGVTVTGSLMFNADASFYRGYGPDYLIGYARDGYPIYGYYEGAVDSCGGYMHASGYRYTISPSRDHVLSCYTATPALFVQ